MGVTGSHVRSLSKPNIADFVTSGMSSNSSGSGPKQVRVDDVPEVRVYQSEDASRGGRGPPGGANLPFVGPTDAHGFPRGEFGRTSGVQRDTAGLANDESRVGSVSSTNPVFGMMPSGQLDFAMLEERGIRTSIQVVTMADAWSESEEDKEPLYESTGWSRSQPQGGGCD